MHIREVMKKKSRKSNLQHLAHVASSEDLVNDGELVGVVGGEIRGEDTVFCAASSQ